MRSTIKKTLAFAVAVFMAFPAMASVEIGKAAPTIHATDVHGHEFNLEALKGKIVVLEWTNNKCPYVLKHYDSGNMQKIQKELRAKGVEWVRVVSSAEGKQGFLTNEEALKVISETGADITAQIADPSGDIGAAYGAKTTPHMFVLDKEGHVAYAGAIDSNPSPRASSIEGAENYVISAVTNLMDGKPVEIAQTAPYGCSVKYAPTH